jgi:hypothetical protein
MRVGSGIVVALCLGLPALGVASEQQDPSGPASTVQAPAGGAPPAETPPEEKKGPEAAPEQATPQPNASEPTEPKAAPQGEPQAAPEKQPQPAEPRTEAQPSEPKNEPEKKTDTGSGGETVRRHAGKKRPAALKGGPRKVVVRHGGADEPTAQIVTGMAPEEADRQRQHAEQLLKSIDGILGRADPHAYNVPQQETVSQIHNYMEGARSALKEGDIERAHTLAMKAVLLAKDLTKH